MSSTVPATTGSSAALGILGGTFDPVHNAHLRLAEEALAQLSLGAVLWIPAGSPSHRHPPVASAAARLAMVRLATAGRPEFPIDEAEVHATEPSFTVPTLERLRRVHGLVRPLVLLMGADAFLGLATWHRWHELFSLAHLAVVSRPGYALATAAMNPELAAEYGRRLAGREALGRGPAGALVTFTMEAGTVSSTEVRDTLARGGDAGALLPGPVLDYISAHRLYRP